MEDWFEGVVLRPGDREDFFSLLRADSHFLSSSVMVNLLMLVTTLVKLVFFFLAALP